MPSRSHILSTFAVNFELQKAIEDAKKFNELDSFINMKDMVLFTGMVLIWVIIYVVAVSF